jgi:hypothetical protein
LLRVASPFHHEGNIMTQESSGLPANLAHYGSLLRAVQGLYNWRAVLLSVIYLGAALPIAHQSVSLATKMDIIYGHPGFFPPLLGVLAALVVLCGVSAVGLVLADQAQGLPPRPFLLVVWDSVGAALRILVVAMIGLVIALVFYILMVFILFVCKFPGVGPMLYGVAFPVLVVASGLLLFGVAVALSIICPAIWNGVSVQGALVMFWQIVTQRTAELFISLVLFALFSALAGYIVLTMLGSGLFFVGSLSASMLDFNIPIDLPRLFLYF